MIEPQYVPSKEEENEWQIKAAKIFQEGFALFCTKNREYGNSIEATGVVGAVVALTGDIARLRNLVLYAPELGKISSENVRDKLMDVMVQAMIGIMMLENHNWEGREL